MLGSSQTPTLSNVKANKTTHTYLGKELPMDTELADAREVLSPSWPGGVPTVRDLLSAHKSISELHKALANQKTKTRIAQAENKRLTKSYFDVSQDLQAAKAAAQVATQAAVAASVAESPRAPSPDPTVAATDDEDDDPDEAIPALTADADDDDDDDDDANAAAPTAAPESSTTPAAPARTGKRTEGREKVKRERTSEAPKYEGLAFFEHHGITNSRALQEKLAIAIIYDPKAPIKDTKKRTAAFNQCKFKADGFLELLWFTPPNNEYVAGDIDSFFAFFDRHRGHDDMGKTDATYASHSHRVAHWFWPNTIKTEAQFNDKANGYISCQAKKYMTGVRAVHDYLYMPYSEPHYDPLPVPPADDTFVFPSARVKGAKRSAAAALLAEVDTMHKRERISNDYDSQGSSQESCEESSPNPPESPPRPSFGAPSDYELWKQNTKWLSDE